VIQPSREREESPALKSRAANQLDLLGGFVLLSGAVAFIVLACVFADKAAVAPIFAVSGATLGILAAFYSRIEGNIEATKVGVKAAVRAAQRKSGDAERAGEEAATEAVNAVAAQANIYQLKHQHLVEQFARWLTDTNGFEDVRRDVLTAQGEFDLIANGRDETMIVEAKVGAGPAAVRHVRELAGRPPPADLIGRTVRRALVISTDKRVSAAVLQEAQAARVEVYAVSNTGSVQRIG